MLSTNKAKRDLVLAERVKEATGGTLVRVDSAKNGGDLTIYYLYITFENDPGPHQWFRPSAGIPEFNAYCVMFKGGIEALDKHTANPQHLRLHVYVERYWKHWKARNLDTLQSDLNRAEKNYGVAATAAMVAAIRGTHGDLTGPGWEETQRTLAEERLRAAVAAYDTALAEMFAIIGAEWPTCDDGYYVSSL